MFRSSAALASLCAFGATAAAQPLYDPAPASGPSDQGWLYPASLLNLLPGVTIDAIESVGPTFTRLDTTPDRDDLIGYFSQVPSGLPNILPAHPRVGVFDDADGFRFIIDARVNSEGHDNRDDNSDGLLDRAGFSILLVDNTLDAIEIAFFEDRIWAYEDGVAVPIDQFTQAEGVDRDTTSGITRYTIAVHSGGYTLSAWGAQILSGPLRDYTAYVPPASLPVDPYESQNMIFFGDDTGSADANVDIGFVDLVQLCVADVTTQGAGARRPRFRRARQPELRRRPQLLRQRVVRDGHIDRGHHDFGRRHRESGLPGARQLRHLGGPQSVRQ